MMMMNGKDSFWLQLEVCREFQRARCTRSDNDCKFAHPPANVEIQPNGRVTACYDSIKGRCQRESCKYMHPPAHLKDQLLINGRNHLALKNALLQQHQQQHQQQQHFQDPMNQVKQEQTKQQAALFQAAVQAATRRHLSCSNSIEPTAQQQHNNNNNLKTPSTTTFDLSMHQSSAHHHHNPAAAALAAAALAASSMNPFMSPGSLTQAYANQYAAAVAAAMAVQQQSAEPKQPPHQLTHSVKAPPAHFVGPAAADRQNDQLAAYYMRAMLAGPLAYPPGYLTGAAASGAESAHYQSVLSGLYPSRLETQQQQPRQTHEYSNKATSNKQLEVACDTSRINETGDKRCKETCSRSNRLEGDTRTRVNGITREEKRESEESEEEEPRVKRVHLSGNISESSCRIATARQATSEDDETRSATDSAPASSDSGSNAETTTNTDNSDKQNGRWTTRDEMLTCKLFGNNNRLNPLTLAPAPRLKDLSKAATLQLEICREFLRNSCERLERYCRFAHPPAHVLASGLAASGGGGAQRAASYAIVCIDFMRGRCTRPSSKCRYLHPAGHLQCQLRLKLSTESAGGKTKQDKDNKIKTQLKVKLEMAKFLQETLDELVVKTKGESHSEEAKKFAKFFEEVRASGAGASNIDILKYSKLFEDEITLDSMSRQQLVACCRLLELQPLGTNTFLRFQLTMRLKTLRADDEMIRSEGIQSLTVSELQAACRARGMRALGVPIERLQAQLSQWLELSLDEKIPPSLLLLSRALYVPENIPTSEQLKVTIQSLPELAGTEVRYNIGETEGKVDNRTMIEFIKREEEEIKREELQESLESFKSEYDEALMVKAEEIIERASKENNVMILKILKEKSEKNDLTMEFLESIENDLAPVASPTSQLLVKKAKEKSKEKSSANKVR